MLENPDFYLSKSHLSMQISICVAFFVADLVVRAIKSNSTPGRIYVSEMHAIILHDWNRVYFASCLYTVIRQLKSTKNTPWVEMSETRCLK